ncbi:uncharacterized protein [Haliotis cracherodii]|uniref:uncharacterized protein n=1 Tax=Haliotis cracherodii TaxID=6455 RepID=UPI0039ED4C16
MVTMLKTLILCLAIPLAASWTLDCTGLENGIYLYTCFSYTECVNGSKGVIKCASNEVFSSKDGLCIKPIDNSWPCQDVVDCKSLPDKRYADAKGGCHTYYTCQNGYFYGHNYCPDGTVFDEEHQFCNWPSNVKKPCGTAD